MIPELIILLSAALGCVAAIFLLWQAVMYAIAWSQRPAVERVVISQIAGVVRQNLPLPMALSLAGDSERGMARTHLKRISKLLAQGASLSEAMKLGYRECSPLMVSLVAAGEKAGRLPAVLEHAEEYLVRKARWRRLFDVSLGFYVVLVLLVAGLMVSGVMVAVIPKFKTIFADFGTTLPKETVTLIEISEWFVAGIPPGWLLALLLPVLWIILRFWKIEDQSVASRIGEVVRSSLPGIRRVEFGQGLAEMLRLMRTAVAGGMDLATAARLASSIRVNRYLRDRMLRFADSLEAGSRPADACRVSDLGPVLSTVLAAGARSGNMDAALRYAADYHGALVTRWWIMLNSIAWPCCTVSLGLIVAFVVKALFEPLVDLIRAVSG
ncbi:MAG: type II secretion system F family protein [Phycisphaerae bacterium]